MFDAEVRRSSWIARRLRIILVGYLLLFGVVAAIAFYTGLQQRAAARGVVQAHEIMLGLERTQSLMKDIETGQRGFLLTGQERFLEPYEFARPVLSRQLDDVGALLATTPLQRERMDNLREAVDAKLDHVDTMISLRRNGHAEEAVERVASGEGKFLMDDVRSIAGSLTRAEQELLHQRMETADQARTLMDYAFGLAGILLIGLLGLQLTFIRSHQRHRQLYEQRLLESDMRMRDAVQALNEAFVLQSASGQVILSNRTALQYFGDDASEEPQRHGFAPAFRTAQEVIVSGVPQQGVLTPISDEWGQERLLTASAAPLFRDNETLPYAVVTTALDVTAKEQVHEMKARLAAFFEANPNPVAALDAQGHLLSTNDATDTLLKTLGKHSLLEILPPDPIKAVRGAAGPVTIEHRVDHLTLAWTFFTAGAHGELIQVYGQNVTERHRLEQEQQEEQRLDLLSKLAGGIAHAFNNLLTVIAGHTSILEQQGANPERITAIEAATDQAAILTKQLLGVARRRMLRIQPVDLTEEIQKTLPQFRTRLQRGPVTFTAEPAPLALADPDALMEMMAELAEFWREAIVDQDGDSGLLHISVEECQVPLRMTEGCVRMRMQCSPCRLRDEDLTQVFEPFRQIEATARTSIGLAVLRGLMSQHGGRVTVEKTGDSGLRIELWFPTANSASHHDKRDARSLTQAGAGRKKGTILVVEDEDNVRDLIVMILQEADYTVLAASRGEEGLTLWRTHRHTIHEIVTDVVMPGMSGIDMARAIRAEDADVPILVISGYSLEVVNEDFMTNSNIRFLAKPFHMAKLLESLAT